jgi:subtilisin family serine protease
MYATPNDPLFAWQQALHNIGQNGALEDADVYAPEAWNIRTGNQRLVIAIIDTGVDTGHPDLQIFRNDSEWGNGREANGVDNDGNGYIDDYQGWDFYGNDNNPNPGSTAAAAHGTPCAGIAGAIGNNTVGIAGAAWKCRILPVKIWSDSAGQGESASVDALAQSIRYAAQFADAISCSWGSATS